MPKLNSSVEISNSNELVFTLKPMSTRALYPTTRGSAAGLPSKLPEPLGDRVKSV
jgi:hypothetical protein